MGCAAAWHLSRRGHEVIVLEQFEAGHSRGSSHGSSRIFRLSYRDPFYVGFAAHSLELWRELEADSGERLFDQTGGVDHGSQIQLDTLAETLDLSGLPYSRLSEREAKATWSGLEFEGDVLYSPEAGRLDADRCVATLVKQAKALGGKFFFERAAASIRPEDERVDVLLEDETIRARHVVVASGAWTERLVGGLLPLPRLSVTREQPAHFFVRDEHATWPSFVHYPDAVSNSPLAYGLLAPEGLKVGIHASGIPWDPDDLSTDFSAQATSALQAYARAWIPGVVAESAAPMTCLYTSTDTQDFVIDREGPVTVGAGFSGHGFKFVPAIGELLADVASEVRDTAPKFGFRS